MSTETARLKREIRAASLEAAEAVGPARDAAIAKHIRLIRELSALKREEKMR